MTEKPVRKFASNNGVGDLSGNNIILYDFSRYLRFHGEVVYLLFCNLATSAHFKHFRNVYF